MFNWLFVYFFRGKDNPPLPTQLTALAFLSSVVADGDVITDWLYYKDIKRSEEDITEWLVILQFVSCICGTISWLGVATDGRLVSTLRSAVYLMAFLLLTIIYLPIIVIWLIFDPIDDVFEYIRDNVLRPLWVRVKQTPSFSSGAVLFLGILVEDIPQLIVTFLIEDIIKSDHEEFSNAALVNLFFAIFDIFHKLAQAYDLRKDVKNATYAVKRTISRGHVDAVRSLALAGVNQILSASEDATAKVWNADTGKCSQVFKCESSFENAVVLGTSKVLAASYMDKSIRIFGFFTGALDYTLQLDYEPLFVCVSPDSGSFFTGGYRLVQRWKMPTGSSTTPQLITTYKGLGAIAITFLDNDTLVCHYYSPFVCIWKIAEEEPMYTILTNEEDVLCSRVESMSPIMFLVGDCLGRINSFEFDNNLWSIHKKFNGHTGKITSLTKINETLFVSTSDDSTAKLWDITKVEASSLFTFQGHTSCVKSSVYLKKEQAIATGDSDGVINIWSIEKYLKHEQNQSVASEDRAFLEHHAQIFCI